jgi:UDP-GlcNAc:undecaprenyl-phosphate GlcNAc-1-phosphate transferase
MIPASITAAVLSVLLSLVAMPLILRLAHRHKWYDPPNSRKIHTGLIPRLGGPAMFLSFLLAAVLTLPLLGLLSRGRIPLAWNLRFLPLFLGITLIHGIGLFDDFRSLSALPKFSLQLLAAAIVTSGGFLVRSITIPYVGLIRLGLFAYPLTVLWIVGISNALNLIDGLDGLAGGIAAFASLSMGVIALIQGATTTAVLCFALFGSVVGFLAFNLPPARIFMGDSGSLFLGFTLAVLPLVGGISKASAFGTLLVPITLLTVPILDTATAILRRLRKRIPIIQPDKEHIHHKLLQMGLNERQILCVLYGFSIYLSAVSVTSVILPREVNVYLILVVWVGSLLGYWSLSYLDTRQLRMHDPKHDEQREDSQSKRSS